MIYIVLRIDESKDDITCNVIDIKQNHTEAYKLMVEIGNKDLISGDVCLMINANRFELFRFNKGWVKNSKKRQYIYIIQKFDSKAKKIVVS